MKVRLRLGPDAGHRVHALGPAGMNVWRPFLLPEGEHETDQDADEDDEDDEDDSESDDTGGDDKKDKSKANEPTAREKALEEEKARHLKRRRAAEARADELDKRLKELEAKDTPEAQRVLKELEDTKKALEESDRSLTQARLENAFLADNTYEWHNPTRALKLADLADVEIDKDGTVTGLKEALNALATSDPYLLKSSADGKQKKDPADGKPGTGDSANGDKKKSKGPDAAALQAKYPGLRR